MGDLQQDLLNLGVALAIGLLIGAERGWKKRDADEGERVAGIRTFGLIGVLGGVIALLAARFGPLTLGLALVAVAVSLTTAYVVNLQRDQDAGITSLMAGLLTFVLGALASMGEQTVAAAAAVVTALLLSYKPQLHQWVRALEAKEIRAGIQLLLMSVVLLPILPDIGLGPWQALNPYVIWWMIVLIAAMSFVGYFAIKIGGARRGIVFTGLFGGVASSTALTWHFARLARRESAPASLLATGILLAGATMLPRMVLIASVLNPRLFLSVLVPACAMLLLLLLPIPWYWRSLADKDELESPLKNPLELRGALTFGVVLVVVLLVTAALKARAGDSAVLVFAAVSGVVDMDAITLSLARLSSEDLTLRIAAAGIVIAASVSSLSKGAAALLLGGKAMGLRAGVPLMVSAIGGIVSGWLWIW
jgi:uncharacterized membrane protein (DUF4010 family)